MGYPFESFSRDPPRPLWRSPCQGLAGPAPPEGLLTEGGRSASEGRRRAAILVRDAKRLLFEPRRKIAASKPLRTGPDSGPIARIRPWRARERGEWKDRARGFSRLLAMMRRRRCECREGCRAALNQLCASQPVSRARKDSAPYATSSVFQSLVSGLQITAGRRRFCARIRSWSAALRPGSS